MAVQLTLGSQGRLYAVLTGDVIRSEQIGDNGLEVVGSILRDIRSVLNQAYPGLVVGEPQVFRGDAWQLVLSEPRLFLRVALYVRARIKSVGPEYDTRIAVGVGTARKLVPRRISESLGEAFTRSGHELDRMGRKKEIRLHLPDEVRAELDWMPVLLHLVGEIAQRWKGRQAVAVAHVLLDEDSKQEDVARKMGGVTRQAANSALVSAGWPALLEAVTLIERRDWSSSWPRAGAS
jgi:hypothetical protein